MCSGVAAEGSRTADVGEEGAMINLLSPTYEWTSYYEWKLWIRNDDTDLGECYNNMKTDEWEIILYLYYYMFLKTCSNLLSYYCLWDSPSYECKCVKYTN